MNHTFRINIIALMLCFFAPLPAYSWGKVVHINTGRDAFGIIFKHIDESVIQEKALRYYMSSGIIEPDQNRVRSHIKLYDCAGGVKSNAKKCDKMIRKKNEWSDIRRIKHAISLRVFVTKSLLIEGSK